MYFQTESSETLYLDNDKPGLGVDLNEKEAAKYPCENTVTTWTQTRNRDGSLQTP